MTIMNPGFGDPTDPLGGVTGFPAQNRRLPLPPVLTWSGIKLTELDNQ